MTPVDDLSVWAQFGLGGVVIAALMGFIVYVVKEHRAERSEWMTELSEQRREWIQAYTQQASVIDLRQKETNEVIRELSNVVSESNFLHKKNA